MRVGRWCLLAGAEHSPAGSGRGHCGLVAILQKEKRNVFTTVFFL